MIAVVQKPGAYPCIAYWTGRVGLSVKVNTWCGETVSASDGVLQVPDNEKVCAACSEAVAHGLPTDRG